MIRGQSLLNGSNIGQTRSYNRRVVLQAVRMWGPLSRADIARLTCLAPQTVSNNAKDLQTAGLLQEQGRRRAGHLPDRPMTALLAGLADPRQSVSSRSDRRYPRIIRAAVGPQVTALGAAVLPIHESMSLQLRVLLKNGDRDSAGVDRRARPRQRTAAVITGPL